MARKTKVEPNGRTDVSGVDLAEVERLLAFMQKHGLEEFEYERRGVHIRLKKASTHPAGVPRPAAVPLAHATIPPAPATSGREAGAEAPGVAEDLHLVKSPIVGTFYAAPSPNAKPFVAVGDRVEPGQVLCIIEAMKLMNEIESDVAGEIARIFVENAQPVEYGEMLFGIRLQGKK
jgi:acetyl-CoA carboxylase biotin carboxyl carrier protein